MSYRVPQLSPGTRVFPVQDQFSAKYRFQSADESSEFLRSWLESESEWNELTPKRMNWSKISGLGAALAVSAAFWAGVAWVVNVIWK